jgi:hypothetical protein
MPNHFDIIDFNPQTHEFGCASCTHSRWHPTQFGGGLWCETHNKEAEDSCPEFSYEPGTDAD